MKKKAEQTIIWKLLDFIGLCIRRGMIVMYLLVVPFNIILYPFIGDWRFVRGLTEFIFWK